MSAAPVPLRADQPSRPAFGREPGGYSWRPEGEAVEFHLSRIERRDGDLCAQADVSWTAPREGHIWSGRVNLENARSRDRLRFRVGCHWGLRQSAPQLTFAARRALLPVLARLMVPHQTGPANKPTNSVRPPSSSVLSHISSNKSRRTPSGSPGS